jgi:hypothetical protein
MQRTKLNDYWQMIVSISKIARPPHLLIVSPIWGLEGYYRQMRIWSNPPQVIKA